MLTVQTVINDWLEKNFESFYANESLRKKFLSAKEVVKMRQGTNQPKMSIEECRKEVFRTNIYNHACEIIIRHRDRVVLRQINEMIKS